MIIHGCEGDVTLPMQARQGAAHRPRFCYSRTLKRRSSWLSITWVVLSESESDRDQASLSSSQVHARITDLRQPSRVFNP